MEKVSTTSGGAKKRKKEMKTAADSPRNKRITSFFQKDSGKNSGVVCLTNRLQAGGKGNSVAVTVKSSQDVSLPQPKHILFSSENVVLGWVDKVPVKEAGMENQGNTCYLNSILQALFHIPAFANWLMRDAHHHGEMCEQDSGPTRADDCLTCALAKTLSAARNNDLIRPELIASKRKMICKGFECGNQEDGHEFLRSLLAKIENEFLKRFPQEMLDPHSRETTPINQIFGGYFRSEVVCDNCGKVSTSFQHFQDLILEISTASTMDQALDLFFSKEVLDGPNAYQCGSCKQLSNATKSCSIEKPPQILCVQLKRFTGSPANRKILKKVEVKREINLQKYLQIPQEYRYKLIATVTHKGNSIAKGHYIATAETSSGNLCLFDDGVVRTIPSSNIESADAYLLFYEHMDDNKKIRGKTANCRVSSNCENPLT